MAAHQLAPDDPRSLNLLALATLRWRGNEGAQTAFDLLQRAHAMATDYLPAIVNMTAIARASGNQELIRSIEAERDARMASAPDWLGIDGPTLPFGFSACAIDRSLALQQAVRIDSPEVFAHALAD
jgi:hypothetical protein